MTSTTILVMAMRMKRTAWIRTLVQWLSSGPINVSHIHIGDVIDMELTKCRCFESDFAGGFGWDRGVLRGMHG